MERQPLRLDDAWAVRPGESRAVIGEEVFTAFRTPNPRGDIDRLGALGGTEWQPLNYGT